MSVTRYTPTENGYRIHGSSELFNRTLYGSHLHDDESARFFTFAGDAPQFMGASTDWQANLVSFYAKCGTLISGLALTPGQRVGFFYSDDMDISSRWFHNSEDITAEFQNGYMRYELSQMSPWFPDARVTIEAYPLLPDDGFLVHYTIHSDQRVLFTAGFGGLTDYIGRFEYKDEQKRYFHASDCADNTVTLGNNRATVRREGRTMYIAAGFNADFSLGSAAALESPFPSTFLGSTPQNDADTVVKISAEIKPNEPFSGYLLVLQNGSDALVDEWLARPNPVQYIQSQIFEKHAAVAVNTPDHSLDLTVAPTVIALDASFHKNSFHHGAFGYHSPFLGWRNWYAPTVLGWNERVEAVIEAHLSQLITAANGDEKIWYDGGGAREGDGPSPYHCIENSTGYLPYLLGETMAYYNMQECALDMMLHHLEWTGNVALANRWFHQFCTILDWEERVLDPDGDGLYQNFLNTWISDGHSYNGAGCAQASAYNYRANVVMAKLAKALGRSPAVFEARAEKIKAAVNAQLWLANRGVVAESVDTVGNRLVHPSPELSTAYLAVDCDIVDSLQAYTLLKYTETDIPSVKTLKSGGRLSYSSNWLPKKYSTFGIFPAENAHLALAYFRHGFREEGNHLLRGLADCYFTGRNPGMAAHVQSVRGTADLADLDFTDVSSTYLRLVVEGLFGVRVQAFDNRITVAPQFPSEWDHASLTLADLSLHYRKNGREEVLDFTCERPERKRLQLPLTASTVDAVFLNGTPAAYTVTPAVGHSVLTVETEAVGRVQLRVLHGSGALPQLTYAPLTAPETTVLFRVENGTLFEAIDTSETLTDMCITGNVVSAKTAAAAGRHTLFLRVKQGDFDAYLPADYEIAAPEKPQTPLVGGTFRPLDVGAHFNCALTEIHNREFLSPRPEGYSIGVFPNGRYAWEWNHRGHNQLYVDDSTLRGAGGVIHTPSGIPFATPQEGNNVACVSVWDNFPTSLTVPLEGTASELALLFVSTTNAMQTDVENARITVTYQSGEQESISLVYPHNIDDWLVPALQHKNEYVYFNEYNHATVQRIALNPQKPLASVTVEAVANEVIVGVLGITLRR